MAKFLPIILSIGLVICFGYSAESEAAKLSNATMGHVNRFFVPYYDYYFNCPVVAIASPCNCCGCDGIKVNGANHLVSCNAIAGQYDVCKDKCDGGRCFFSIPDLDGADLLSTEGVNVEDEDVDYYCCEDNDDETCREGAQNAKVCDFSSSNYGDCCNNYSSYDCSTNSKQANKA